MQQQPKFKGVPFFLNGKDYVVPPLSLRQFEENYEALTSPVGDVSQDTLRHNFKKFVPIIGLALRRNYPEISDDDLMDWLDLGSFRNAIFAVQAALKMEAAAPGE